MARRQWRGATQAVFCYSNPAGFGKSGIRLSSAARGREDSERAALPLSLHSAALFPLRTLVNIVWLKSILQCSISFPPLRGTHKQRPNRAQASWFIFVISVYLLMCFLACGRKAAGNEELCIKKHSRNPHILDSGNVLCLDIFTMEVTLNFIIMFAQTTFQEY